MENQIKVWLFVCKAVSLNRLDCSRCTSIADDKILMVESVSNVTRRMRLESEKNTGRTIFTTQTARNYHTTSTTIIPYQQPHTE